MTDVPHLVLAMGTSGTARHERAIAELAARQLGVVSRQQLLAAGLSQAAIGRRVASGRLQRLHHTVYAVGHRALRADALRLAAVLACGPDAVVSHRTAADLWGIRRSDRATVDVTISGKRRRQPRIDTHEGRLVVADIATRNGIPVTTIARTLLDLAEVVPRRQLERALDETIRLRLFDRRAIERLVARSRGRHGLKPLSIALAALDVGRSLTRSELERRALELIEAHDLPRPSVNAWVEGYEVDLLWRTQRLVVELDGFAFHSSPATFERDRRRDADLQAAGYRVLRFSWRQLNEDPGWVAARVAALLASA